MAETSKSELVRICKKIGAEIPRWTQGAGGNVSVKDGTTLWIKATGVRLDGVTDAFGLAEVNGERIVSELKALGASDEEGYRDLVQSSAISGRPSMETGFHAVLKSRWVAHFHSLPAILMFQRFLTDPKAMTAWARHQAMSMAWIAIKMPGLELSQALVSNSAEVIILQNHGVVLQCNGDSPADLLSTWRELEDDFCQFWGYGQPTAFSRSIPLRAYFPDVSVFIDRILAITEKSGDFHKLVVNAQKIDRDAVEIFEAMQWLYRQCSALTELPLAMSKKLPDLPTEKLRRGA